MGASSSSHETFLRHAELLRKVATLSYADFMATVEHLNLVAEQHVDPQGKRLVFAIRSNTADSILWKATVRIDCFKVNCSNGQIESARILTLNDFVTLYDQITVHIESASVGASSQDSSSCPDGLSEDLSRHGTAMDASMLLAKIDEIESPGAMGVSPSEKDSKKPEASEETKKEISEPITECCICMERKSSIVLPCSHTYCEECIDHWFNCEGEGQSCPMCRSRLTDKSEQWVLMSDRPDAREVEREVSSCVVGFAERAGRPGDDDG